MNASQARTLAWRDARPDAVVLVFGAEEVFAERATAHIRDLLREEDPALEISDVRADDYEAGDLLALTAPSLFGEPRLVRVGGVEKCTDAFLAETLAYIENPQPGATVVLRHTGASVRGKKLLDAIRAGAGLEVACPAIKSYDDRHAFASGEFRAANRKIAGSALVTLTNAFGDDVAELAAACQQLIDDTTGTIDDATVEKYYGGRVEVTAFVVADAAIAGRLGDALVGLRRALASGADPVPIVAAFAMKLRTMAKVAGVPGQAPDLAKQLKMQTWQVNRAKKDLTGWKEETLSLAIQAVARADEEVKGASRDPLFALERMVTVIATKAPYGQ